ncbi:MAG TPA: hypothetical protein VLF91_03715 [Candidatus Saccharimonadales bacterium]|nr:hypothetical protein [Candidatus Saccharimonadales bacterium]
MYLIASDQHERTRAFDDLVADTKIGYEERREALAATGYAFDELIDSLYLPNVVDGRVQPTAQSAELGKIALVPVSGAEAYKGVDLAPVAFRLGALQDIRVGYSELYGRELTYDELQDILRPLGGGNLEDEADWREFRIGLSKADGAQTQFPHKLSREQMKYRAGSPVIVYPAQRIRTLSDELMTASVVLHELAHAQDIRKAGILALTHAGVVAIELRGYNVSDITLAEVTDDNFTAWTASLSARHVRALRERHGSPDQPFAPTERLTQEMYAAGYARS